MSKNTEKIKELEQKQAEYLDLLQRIQAEFENYKKRIEKEQSEAIKFSNAQLIKKFLPLLDDFDSALKTETTSHEELKKGISLLNSKLKKLLEEEGLREISAINEKFDPYKHEVLLQEESEKEEEVILEELQRGYFIHDKILRPSKVKISKKKEENNNLLGGNQNE